MVKISSPEKAAFEILVSRYRTDPKLFEQHFPDISPIVRQVVEPKRISRQPFSLTERERAHRVKELTAIVDKLEPSPQDAIRALEHCAVLIQDDFMTPHVSHKLVVSLFKSAFGKSPGSIRENTTIEIDVKGKTEPIYKSSLVRGVVAHLNLDMRVVSVEITPHRVREGNKMMGIVGIGKDCSSDVAIRHDDYMAEQAPHGSS